MMAVDPLTAVLGVVAALLLSALLFIVRVVRALPPLQKVCTRVCV